MFSSSKMVACVLMLMLVVQLNQASASRSRLSAESTEAMLVEHHLSAAQARELNRTSASGAQQAGLRLQAARYPETAANSMRHTSHTSQHHQASSELLLPSASSQAHLLTLSPQTIASRAAIGKLVSSTTTSGSSGGGAPPPNTTSSLAAVRLKWRQMEQAISGRLTRVGLSLRGELDELLASNKQTGGVSQVCRAALHEFLNALADQELWASQMLDASAAKLPSGLLEGTLTELGHFDECLAVSSSSRGAAGSNQAIVRGQYCSLSIKPALINRPRLHTICRRLPSLTSGTGGNGSAVMRFLGQNSHQFLYVGLRLGLCAPTKCSAADLQHLLSAYLQPFELVGQVRHCQQQPLAPPSSQAADDDGANPLLVYLQQAYANSSILHKFDLVQQCILLAFCLLFLLTALGTWLDTSHRRRRRPWRLKAGGETSDEFAHYANVTNGLTSTAPLDVEGAPRRTWQEYQVCRSISTFSNGASSGAPCASSGAQSTPSPSSSNCHPGAHLLPPAPPLPPPDLLYLNSQRQQQQQLGLQMNPIAELVASVNSASSSASPPSSSAASPASAACDGAAVQRTFLSPSSSSSSSTNLNNNNHRHFEHLTARAAQRKHGAPDYGRDSAGNSSWRQFLACFSLATNLRSIGKRAPSSSSSTNSTSDVAAATTTDIKVIHGLRTLSMIWIIFGHTIGLVGPEMMNNLFQLAQLSCSSRLLQALLNTTLAVDTFFMISGLVTAVSFARKCRSARLLLIGNGISPPPPPHLLHGLKQADLLAAAAAESQSAASSYGRDHQSCNNNKRAADLEEISSVDSASSASTSLGSSASSNQCIGLKSAAAAAGTTMTTPSASSRVKMGGKSVSGSGEAPPGRCWPSDFKPLMWLLMRYLRLTPAYAATIGLALVLPALGSGPFWPETLGQMGPACRSNWWLNLLYLNNFLETDKLCLIHSWYLSNDWQFFLLTLVLFATMYKSKKLTLLLLVSIAMASSATTFVATVEHEFPPTIVTTSPAVAERWQFIHQLYYKPWPHLPAYLVGLLVSYLLLLQPQAQPTTTHGNIKISTSASSSAQQTKRNKPHKHERHHHDQLSRNARYLCWTLFSLVGLAVLNSIYPWNMGLQVEPLLAGLHSATFRTLWAACCGWLVYALVTRPRNPLALFLSWHGFQVTSRLTYCAYLVHPLIIYFHFGTLRERLDSSPYGQLHRFMATLAQSYLAALLLSLLVEGPSIQLQRFITRLLSGDGVEARESAAREQGLHNANKHWNLAAADASKAHHAMHHNCELHQHQPNIERPTPKGRRSGGGSDSSSHSASAIDVEFQKKLAQAIGRGFKIRTKIFNGNSANSIRGHQVGKRSNFAVRRHAGEQLGVAFATTPDILNDRPETAVSSPPRAQPKQVFAARATVGGEQLSTFVANPAQQQHQQHYVRPTSRKTVEELPAESCLMSSLAPMQQADMPPCCATTATSPANMDLRQMIQMKHKLLTQRQQQRHDEGGEQC